MLHIAELGISVSLCHCVTVLDPVIMISRVQKRVDSTAGKSQRILHVQHRKHGVTSSSIPPLLCCSPSPQWIPLLCGRCTSVSHRVDQQVNYSMCRYATSPV